MTDPTPRQALEYLEGALPARQPDSALDAWLTTIRRALEAAAAEAEAMAALFDWSPHVGITQPGGHVTTWTVQIEQSAKHYFDGATRLGALQRAAAYVKEQEQHG